MPETPDFQNRFEGPVRSVIQSERVSIAAETQHFTPWEQRRRPNCWTDRDSLLKDLVECLRSPDPRPVVLTGPREVGKTALAGVVASEVKGSYPDGILHVDLEDTSCDDAMRSAMSRMGRVDLPSGISDLNKLYRSMLAAYRMLVILDGARTKDDILTFWPQSDSTAYIVLTAKRFHWSEASHFLVPPLDTADAAVLLQREASLTREVAELLVNAFGGVPGPLLRAGGILALGKIKLDELLGLAGEGRERRLLLKALDSVGEDAQRVYGTLGRLAIPVLEQSLLDFVDSEFEEDSPTEDLKAAGLIVKVGADSWRLAFCSEDSKAGEANE